MAFLISAVNSEAREEEEIRTIPPFYLSNLKSERDATKSEEGMEVLKCRQTLCKVLNFYSWFCFTMLFSCTSRSYIDWHCSSSKLTSDNCFDEAFRGIQSDFFSFTDVEIWLNCSVKSTDVCQQVKCKTFPKVETIIRVNNRCTLSSVKFYSRHFASIE